ncbi:unnamed protein product [Staurois parvus]|uniref:Uncharacterized protein n=1 Tax=Staurois parvus TaxID=386267 RepID=A0ABN9HA25_9NEOB|nr:unnamed protein product [Staurois parvus]
MGPLCSCPNSKKAYEKGTRGASHGAPYWQCRGFQMGIMGPLCPCPNSKKPMKKVPGACHGAPY